MTLGSQALSSQATATASNHHRRLRMPGLVWVTLVLLKGDMIHFFPCVYTFSVRWTPKIPDGLNKRIKIKMANARASL